MTAIGTGHTVITIRSTAVVVESRKSSMHTLKVVISVAWIVFWIYWLASAANSKESVKGGWRTRLTGVSAIGVFLIAGVLRNGSLAVHSVILAAIGTLLFACGIALAVWARLHLGSNWGMPTTQRAEPELVTSGPYRFVRHPIYTGLLTAMLGTALVNSLLGLIVVAVLVAYFYYCGTVEERNLTATFPTGYPEYRSRTKMLIPFLL
jgi:protein-S-isoprenylcysteine O-methyltransferase Ste14